MWIGIAKLHFFSDIPNLFRIKMRRNFYPTKCQPIKIPHKPLQSEKTWRIFGFLYTPKLTFTCSCPRKRNSTLHIRTKEAIDIYTFHIVQLLHWMTSFLHKKHTASARAKGKTEKAFREIETPFRKILSAFQFGNEAHWLTTSKSEQIKSRINTMYILILYTLSLTASAEV